MNSFLFISNNTVTDTGLSGGDRILAEFIKNWSKKYPCGLLATGECIGQLNRYEVLKKVTILQSAPLKKRITSFNNITYFIHGINRTIVGIFSVIKFWKQIKDYKYIYSASDFYPDTIPAFLIKIFHPKTIWVGGFYLFAPKPWQKDNPYRTNFSRFLTNIFYWSTQQLSYFLVNNFADIVCVTSNPDIKHFITDFRNSKNIIVVRGGVDLTQSRKYLKKYTPTFEGKKYRTLYIGRLHHQKGPLELIDIWRLVVNQFPKAQLAMIGDGQLLADVKAKIKRLKLTKNVTLFGFVDGEEKFKIFKQAAIAVHPATYDSGGMATAEAMAWGLPGVSFDLEALKTYYPQGLIKTKCYDLQEFANNIIKLTTDKKLYAKNAKLAIELMEKHWAWDTRALQVVNQILKAKINHD
jgi:glycosyltransferase involved in cell wall biosynthesis